MQQLMNSYYNDNLNLISAILQVIDLALLFGDASNEDVLRELQRQNAEYMDKIIEQNNEILSILRDK